jgi:hypothetical protein
MNRKNRNSRPGAGILFGAQQAGEVLLGDE